MLKITAVLLLLFSIANTAVASGLDVAGHELYKRDPKTYYVQHRANADGDQRRGVDTMSVLAIVKVAGYLDWTSAQRYIQVSKKFYNLRNRVLISQLPNFYRSLGLNYGDVFLKLDHPQWTPAVLPDVMTVKLHYDWFYRAMKNVDVDNLVALKLFYSAGCLGHMLAAERAGGLLFYASLDAFRPVLISYDFLEPEAEIYDISRLSRPDSDNPKLQAILDQWEEMDDSDDDEESDKNVPERISQLKTVIQQLEKIEQTDEVAVVKMFLAENAAFLDLYGSSKEFVSVKAIAYAKELNVMTPLLYGLINSEINSDDEIAEERSLTKQFEMQLNADTVTDCAQLLSKMIYRYSPHPTDKDGSILLLLHTPEAKNALQKQILLNRIAYLLGGEYPSIMVMGEMNFFDARIDQMDSVAYQDLIGKETSAEICTNTFLYYLAMTRSPTEKCYRELRQVLSNSLVDENLELLDQHFNYK